VNPAPSPEGQVFYAEYSHQIAIHPHIKKDDALKGAG